MRFHEAAIPLTDGNFDTVGPGWRGLVSRHSTRHGCTEFRHEPRVNRRGFLKAGGLGVAGLTLADLLRHESLAGASARTENSVLLLWMRGGPSQHETWDPKPLAPVEVRGAFGAIPTNVPGIEIVDLLPECAKIMDKWSIIRSLHHDNAGHSAGDQIMFTGYNPGRDPNQNVHPSCGAVVSEQLRYLTADMPPYVIIPRQVPGSDSAYLGVAHKPFETITDPAKHGPFRLQNFSLVEGMTDGRFSGRKDLLRNFDRLRTDLDNSGHLEAVGKFQQQAYSILQSDRARKAFDLDTPNRAKFGIGMVSCPDTIRWIRAAAARTHSHNACYWVGDWLKPECDWSLLTVAGGTRMWKASTRCAMDFCHVGISAFRR